MNKELELEAEEFAINNHLKKYKLSGEKDKDCFIKGATSKWVEKQKLEFAISLLKVIEQPNGDLLGSKINLKIEELEQKLSQL